MPLWKHQKAALEAIKNTEETKYYLELPCGTGKTKIIEKQISNSHKDKTTKNHVLVVPNLVLIEQFSDSLNLEGFNRFYICTGTNLLEKGIHTTNVKIIAKHLGVEYDEYEETDYKVYEDINQEIDPTNTETKGEVVKEVKKKKQIYEVDHENPNLIITSYNSLEVIIDLLKKSEFKIDLMVFDEAHHATESKLVQRLYKMDDKIDIYSHFTATKHKNEKIPTIYSYEFRNAVNDNIINDYQVYLMLYQTKEDIPDANSPDRVKEMCKGIDKLMKFLGNKHAILYNSFSKSSNDISTNTKEFYQDFIETVGNENVYKLISGSSIKDRCKILEDFAEDSKESYKLLINCRMLSEGINIPKCDTAIFADPTFSKVLTIQRLGRMVRKTANNKKPVVIIPVYLNGAKFDLYDLTRYKYVISFIRSMSKYDTELNKFVDESNHTKINIFNHNIPAVEFDEQKLKSKLSKSIDSSNINEFFKEYMEFYNTNKRFPVERPDSSAKERNLSFKMQRIKGKYVDDLENPDSPKTCPLSEQQIEQLNKLPKFQWSIQDGWDRDFEILKKYIETNGRLPPAKLPDGRLNPEYNWIKTQRQQRTKNNLIKDRIDKLNTLPGWKWALDKTVWFDKYFKTTNYVFEKGRRYVVSEKIDGWSPYSYIIKNLESVNNPKGKLTSLQKYLIQIFVKLFDNNGNFLKTRDKTLYLILNILDRNDIDHDIDVEPDMTKVSLNDIKEEEYGYDCTHDLKTNKSNSIKLEKKTEVKEEVKEAKVEVNPEDLPSIVKAKKYKMPVLDKLIKESAKTKARSTANQDKFRQTVLNRFNRKCIITNAKMECLLQAAHIIPASLCDKYHNKNLDNGLLLRVDFHMLFDKFYFTIKPDKKIIISDKCKEDMDVYNILSTCKLPDDIIFTDVETVHLEWHNKSFEAMNAVE